MLNKIKLRTYQVPRFVHYCEIKSRKMANKWRTY
nr:MAG TPA: hypothetical protein [Bacteriophage sp.]